MNILGKGVDAIEVNALSIDLNNKSANLMQDISITKISVGNYQPRKIHAISKTALQDLVSSIKEQGILQPIIVRILVNGHYEIIAGERRYHAAIEAGLKEIPCIIKDVTQKEAFAIALIENIQREQLSVLEEADSMLKLKDEFILTVDEVARLISKPRSTVANLIRVALLLCPEGKIYWEQNKITYGHVRAVLGLEHEMQRVLLQYIVENKLSVRETEKIVRNRSYTELNVRLIDHHIVNAVNENIRLKEIKEKISTVFNKNIQIKVLQSGTIRLLIEFDNLDNINDYLNENFSKKDYIE